MNDTTLYIERTDSEPDTPEAFRMRYLEVMAELSGREVQHVDRLPDELRPQDPVDIEARLLDEFAAKGMNRQQRRRAEREARKALVK